MSLRFALLTAFLAGALATPGLAALDGRTLEGGTLEGGTLEGWTLDTEIDRLMTVGKVPGLAMAVIENGKVAHVVAKGVRNEKGDPLQADTIMYAASITKATFAYYVLMLVDEMPQWGALGPRSLKGSPVTIHLYVEDADATVAQAVKAGARVTLPLHDAFWGDRYGQLEDPFGHKWSVATHTRDLTEAQIREAMMKMDPRGNA